MTSSRVGLLLLPWVLVLGGCSWIYGEDGLFPDNTDRYQEAPELAVIEVPDDVNTVPWTPPTRSLMCNRVFCWRVSSRYPGRHP